LTSIYSKLLSPRKYPKTSVKLSAKSIRSAKANPEKHNSKKQNSFHLIKTNKQGFYLKFVI